MRSTCLFAICIACFLTGCKHTPEEQTGEDIAKRYCSSCHIFPSPALLDKKTWASNVLPVMGKKLGLNFFNGEAYPAPAAGETYNSPAKQTTTISLQDWAKLTEYYKAMAPDGMPAQNRPPVKQVTNQFIASEMVVDKGFPSATYVKIDPGNKWIYASNATDSSLYIFDSQLKKLGTQNVHGVVVDMTFDNLNTTGGRKGSFISIGYINPNDSKTGNLFNYTITTQGSFKRDSMLTDSMPRPVQATACDLDKDGVTDYLVCGFGNNEGAFYWLKKKGNGFEKKIIWAIPGAIKAYVDDYNNDGLPDILALFAQGEEGIYLFTNTGNGNFKKKDILRFPPVYGSSYFELADFNNDGKKDILYTCGDNADFTSHELKNYHGVYIYLNDGNYNFTQAYFFAMHGCYKAMARDFDKDGDLDIAAISFFPDKINQPQEAFVYLQNAGRFAFTPYTIPQYSKGNWLTMDAGDLDGDGFDDIVIGNLDMPKIRSNSKDQQINKTAFLLLKNKGR